MRTLMGSRPQPTSYNRYGTDADKEEKEKEKKLRGRNRARTRPTPSGSGVPSGLTGRNKPKNLKQKERDSVIEKVKTAQNKTGLVKKPMTTGGKNPRSLNYPTGVSAPKKATPEGGRAGFMAGMTGGQGKKKTPAKKKTDLGIMGMGLGPKTNRQRVEDAVSQGVKMPNIGSKKVTKTGPKTSTGNTVNYSEATRPKKKAAAKSKTSTGNTVNYSEATRPKGSKDLIGDNKVNYSEATRPKKVAKKKTETKKKTTSKETANKKAEPKKKSFREKRLDRMSERLTSAKSEGRKRRIKRRMERVKGRMADDEKEPKKMMGGGMMKTKGYSAGGAKKTKGYAVGGMKTKGSMAGGKMKSKGYSAGGVKKTKAKKMRGAGIESRGYRPAKMF
tara:strand:+ start:478 stop:1641 length:1164 start_codon:yes stop_codon:yes gene_type:complete